jgi:MFS transporter, DHA1 family, multidrug resistance protein
MDRRIGISPALPAPSQTMQVPHVIRDSFFGQIIYYTSGRRVFRYPEEEPGFVLPPRYAAVADDHSPPATRSPNSTLSNRSSQTSTVLEDRGPSKTAADIDGSGSRLQEKQVESPPRESSALPDEKLATERKGFSESRPVHMPRRESQMAEEILHASSREAPQAELGEIGNEKSRQEQENPYIVDWYGPDDPEAPQNVSLLSHCRTLC